MKQLDKEERLEFSLLKSKGYSLRGIAKAMGRSPSTLSRELKRNSTGGEYHPEKAQHKKYARRKYCKFHLKKIVRSPGLEEYIRGKLRLRWSPEQISGRWNRDRQTRISHVTIYKYVYSNYGCDLSPFLLSRRERRMRRKRKGARRESIRHRTWIDDRPAVINDRRRLGDLEGDTIISRKGDRAAILTLVDRKSRFLFARKLPDLKPSRVLGKIRAIEKACEIHSVTFDNGLEFRSHHRLSCPTYFCHPYSSWEKGQVEYANRLIRRFIPKRSEIKAFSPQFLAKVVALINTTPRKCLNYLTPQEVFYPSSVAIDPLI